jgi:hypothetical protein
MEYFYGLVVWGVVFAVWYFKQYPQAFKSFLPFPSLKWRGLRRGRRKTRLRPPSDIIETEDYKALVENVEHICAYERYTLADAAALTLAIRKLIEIEPASGRIWEAYALDSLESARITCNECKIVVRKTVKRTGVKISCPQCEKWIALKNSKLMVLDLNRPDLEDWEKH